MRENDVADLFAGLASAHALTLNDIVDDDNNISVLASINAIRAPRNCCKATSLPFLSPHSVTCTECHCPSHCVDTCFLQTMESFPCLVHYGKCQPDRPPSFAASLQTHPPSTGNMLRQASHTQTSPASLPRASMLFVNFTLQTVSYTQSACSLSPIALLMATSPDTSDPKYDNETLCLTNQMLSSNST